jgi:hypothetical protein
MHTSLKNPLSLTPSDPFLEYYQVIPVYHLIIIFIT